MKRSLIFLTVFVVAFALVTAGCGSQSAAPEKSTEAVGATEKPTTAAEPIIIKFAHQNSPQDNVNKAAEMIKEGVEARTNGAVKIEIFPSGQVGDNKEALEQARLGGNIMGQFGCTTLEEYMPDYGIFLYPFMFENWEQATKLTNSDLVKGWEKKLQSEQNIVVLGYANFGVRNMYSVKKPIYSPEDTKGMGIRVQPTKMYNEMIKGLGANPQSIPWMELYSALAQNVVDAAEAPVTSMLDQKHNEVVKYLTLTGHVVDVCNFCIGNDIYNKLNEEQKSILSEETLKAADWYSNETATVSEALFDEVEASGVTVIRDVDKAPFREATKDVYKVFPEWSEGLYDQVRAIIEG